MEKIKFQLEDGTEVEFYVEEQTKIGGTAYLLVSDSLDDEATAYIFKDVSAAFHFYISRSTSSSSICSNTLNTA